MPSVLRGNRLWTRYLAQPEMATDLQSRSSGRPGSRCRSRVSALAVGLVGGARDHPVATICVSSPAHLLLPTGRRGMWVIRLQSSSIKRSSTAIALRIPSTRVPVIFAGPRTRFSDPAVARIWTQAIASPSAASGRLQRWALAADASFRTPSTLMQQDDMAEQQQQEQLQEESVKESEIMSESYGCGYATRSEDDGFGQVYCDTVKVVKEEAAGQGNGHPRTPPAIHVVTLSKAADADLQNESDEEPGTIPHDFDTAQGSPVVQKEYGRHSLREDACEGGERGKKRAQEAPSS